MHQGGKIWSKKGILVYTSWSHFSARANKEGLSRLMGKEDINKNKARYFIPSRSNLH